MYYDDQSRRFNLLSGLLFGAVLGAGIALLLLPEAGARTRRIRRAAGGIGRKASRRLSELQEDLDDTLQGSIRAGRKHVRAGRKRLNL
ncbi:MAG TPA: hypothetical protein VHG28_12520 [Longimicrobiaceae bacterium]|nr:hypothetical protein [Longimicrobiaceae bacterium]